MALLIKDHHVGLDQIRVDANDVIGLCRRLLRFCLRWRRLNKQKHTKRYERAKQSRFEVQSVVHGLLRNSLMLLLTLSASVAFGSSFRYFSNSSAASLFLCVLM